jgi:DNA-binding transcriptional regulator YiaG
VIVPTIDESLARLLKLPEDIKLIREKEGLGHSAFARSLGISRVQLWYWEKGKSLPKEPLILLGLMSWAERFRNTTS